MEKETKTEKCIAPWPIWCFCLYRDNRWQCRAPEGRECEYMTKEQAKKSPNPHAIAR